MTPVQLQLTFRKAATGKNSKGFLEGGGVTVLPLLALPVARMPELIAALAGLEESRACPDTKRRTRSQVFSF